MPPFLIYLPAAWRERNGSSHSARAHPAPAVRLQTGGAGEGGDPVALEREEDHRRPAFLLTLRASSFCTPPPPLGTDPEKKLLLLLIPRPARRAEPWRRKMRGSRRCPRRCSRMSSSTRWATSTPRYLGARAREKERERCVPAAAAFWPGAGDAGAAYGDGGFPLFPPGLPKRVRPQRRPGLTGSGGFFPQFCWGFPGCCCATSRQACLSLSPTHRVSDRARRFSRAPGFVVLPRF